MKNSDQPQNWSKTTVLLTELRIALTLNVKIAWFGCQVAVCVNKRHINVIFGCSQCQSHVNLIKILRYNLFQLF